MCSFRFPIFFSVLLSALLLAPTTPTQAGSACPTGAICPASPAPASASLPAPIISIWGGARDCLILLSNGSVWDWGMNQSGKLGDNTVSVFPPSDPWSDGSNDRWLPMQVHGPNNVGYLTSVIAIMGGEAHNFALKSDGTVWSWGWNALGQLGDGTYTERHTPVQVVGLSNVIALGGRGYHSLAIKSGGTVWDWGYNQAGELGDGTTANSNVPVQVSGLSGVTAVTGGYEHSLALIGNPGTLWAWGLNNSGQLGNGNKVNQSLPVQVLNMSNVTRVSAGWDHTVALKADGTLWAWGWNKNGQLGDGTTITRTTPVQVVFVSPSIFLPVVLH